MKFLFVIALSVMAASCSTTRIDQKGKSACHEQQRIPQGIQYMLNK